MFRTITMAFAALGLTTTLALASLTSAPNLNAAAVADSKACPRAARVPGSTLATQTGPERIAPNAGSIKPTDPGTTRLNSGCQPLSAPLPPQGAGKTFSP